ncbi:hypothetical protein IJ768_03910 [Candidatus Saccharibacteria bacterium]|nr:hypothetical protein [Candidatus Saccharibacteria bacterium]
MDNNPNPEPNKELENAANALNEAAKVEEPAGEMPSEPPVETPAEAPAEAPVETPAPAPIAESTSESVAEPTPTEPTSAPEPVATPAIEPTPVVAAPAVEPVAPTAAPGKKKGGKKGLIIGCVAGAVVLLGGGGVAAAYMVNNTPENAILSAVSDLFTRESMTLSGYVEISNTSDKSDDCTGSDVYSTNCVSYSSPVTRVRLDLENSVDADKETKTTATFTVTYNEKDIKITVDSVVVKDYTVYVSLSNLKQAVKDVMSAASNEYVYGDYVELYEDLIDKVAGEVEGTWWKISVPDLVDSTDQIDSSSKTAIKETYSCVVDVANKAAKDGSKYADIYKSNQFITAKKYEGGKKPSASGTLYSVTLDAEKFASFANAMADQVDSYGIEDCLKKLDGVNGVSTSYSKTTVKAESFTDAFEEISDGLIIAVNNGFFSHKLSGAYFEYAKNNASVIVDLKLEDLKGTISAPSNTKDASELVETVTNAYNEWYETAQCKTMKAQYPNYYNIYCDPETNKLRPEYQSYLNGASSSSSTNYYYI